MKKIKKYDQQKSANSLASKIASYSALAGAMMAIAPGAAAQCGAAGSASPILDIDINGDNVTDVSINWVNFNSSLGLNFSTLVPATVVPIVPPGSFATFPAPLQFNSVTNFSWANGYNLSNSVSSTFAPFANSVAGPFPGPYGGVTAGGCYSLFGGGVTFAPLSFSAMTGSDQIVFAGFASSYLYLTYGIFNGVYSSLNVNFAYAQAGAGNQIIGLSAAGADVCSAATTGGATIGAVPASNLASLGSNATVNSSFKTFSLYAFNGGDAYFQAVFPVNGTTCGSLAPINTVVANFGYVDIPTAGTFVNLLNSGTGVVSSVQNINATTQIAIQFEGPDQDGDGNPDNYNGWVEISIDPATSEVTCVGSGYQECSIENAVAVSGDAANACIAVGEATNESAACMEEPPADIPTTGEWGLIILGLMMSITAIVGIRQRKEEENEVWS